MSDQFSIAGRTFRSRLMIGTGKYRSFQEMVRCHEASGAEVVTVAVRRVNLTDKSKESMLDYIDRSKYFILPNTAACYTVDDAVRTARLGREVGLSNWVKLEVIGDEKTLYPDVFGLVEATLVRGPVRDGWSDSSITPDTSIDVTLAHLSRRTSSQFAVELAYPWGREDGKAGEGGDYRAFHHCLRSAGPYSPMGPTVSRNIKKAECVAASSAWGHSDLNGVEGGSRLSF